MATVCASCEYREESCKCNCTHAQAGKPKIKLCANCCTHYPCDKCKLCRPPRMGENDDTRRSYGWCVCAVCLNCGSYETPLCTCCERPSRPPNQRRFTGQYRLCENCCRHDCCSVRVEMNNRPIVFWTPTAALAKHEFPFAPLNNIESEEVLCKQVGSGKLNLHQFRNNPIRRYVAVEIEVSSTKSGGFINEVCQKWNASIVHDGSINDHRPGGFEINTAPAIGDAFTQQLREICDALLKAKSTVNNTCGLHVHVDARDFVYQDIYRLISTYVPIEPAFFAATTPDRRNSRFCRPCAKDYREQILERTGKDPRTKMLKDAVITTTYGPTALARRKSIIGRDVGHPEFYAYRNQHRGAGDNSARYWALNIHTIYRQGTIESRLHHGTLDFDEIFGWAKINLDWVDSVARTSHIEITKALGIDDDYLRREIGRMIGVRMPSRPTSILGKLVTGIMILSQLVPDEDIFFLCDQIRKQRGASE